MRINMRHLRFIAAAAECGSYRGASKRLGLSEGAISAAVKLIEDEIGYGIFVRSSAKGIVLSHSGQEFLRHARRLLAEADDFETNVFSLNDEVRGTIRIGCYFVPAPFLIGPLVKRLSQHNSDINVELFENNLDDTVRDLKNGKVDVTFTYDIYKDKEVHYDPIFKIRPHVILSAESDLAAAEAVSLAELAGRPLALLDLPSSYDHLEFLNLFADVGVRPLVRYRVKNFELVRSLVGANLAYSFGRLPIHSAYSYDGTEVVRRPIVEPVPEYTMCAVAPRAAARSRLIDCVVRHAKEAARDLGVAG